MGRLDIDWPEYDQPPLREFDFSKTVPAKDAELTDNFHNRRQIAGMWFQRVPANMLRESKPMPQVTMAVEDSLALCMDNQGCDYEMLSDYIIEKIEIDGSTIKLTTERDWDLAKVASIKIGHVDCESVSKEGSGKITCQIPDHVCGGTNIVKVSIHNYGYAEMSNGDEFTVEFDHNILTVSPSTGSIAGGQIVTLTGTRLCKRLIENNLRIDGKPV